MKKSRRQELKTNVLSVYLQQAYQTLSRYANYIIGIVVVLVVVLIAYMMVQRNRQAILDQAQRTYFELRKGDVTREPELIDRAARLALEQGVTTEIGSRAAELQADMACDLALSLALADRDQKIARLKEAKALYEQLIGLMSDRPDAAARLRMSLAAAEESLAVLGEGAPDAVRRLYEQVVHAPDNAYRTLAEGKLKSLDERLAELRIVATRPATAPATASAPATVPDMVRITPSTAPAAPATGPAP